MRTKRRGARKPTGVDGDDEAAAGTGDKGHLPARILAVLGPLARGGLSAAKQGVQVAVRYPRASLASGLSAVILAGVMVLQPGKGKNDTTVRSATRPHGRRPVDRRLKLPTRRARRAGNTTIPRRPRARGDEPDPPVIVAGQGPKPTGVPPEPSPPAPAPAPGAGPLADAKAAPAPVGEDVPGPSLAPAGTHPRATPHPAPPPLPLPPRRPRCRPSIR